MTTDRPVETTARDVRLLRLKALAILVGAILAIAILTWVALTPRTVRLLDRATRIEPMSNYVWSPPRFWISERQALIVRPLSVSGGYKGFEALIAEPDKKAVVLQPFTRRYRDSLSDDHTALSPDGRWLAWLPDSSVDEVVAATLDGKKEVRRERDAFATTASDMFWLPNGSHWVEIAGRNRTPSGFGTKLETVRIYDLHSPKVRVVRLPNRVSEHRPLGITSKGKLLLLDVGISHPHIPPEVSLSECSLDTVVPISKTTQVFSTGSCRAFRHSLYTGGRSSRFGIGSESSAAWSAIPARDYRTHGLAR